MCRVHAYLDSGQASSAPTVSVGLCFLLDGAFVDAHDRAPELERVFLLALEGVAAHDRAEAAAIADGTHFVEDLLVASGRATGEDHDAAPIEGALMTCFTRSVRVEIGISYFW